MTERSIHSTSTARRNMAKGPVVGPSLGKRDVLGLVATLVVTW